jgi:hypothetical protein
MKIIIIFIYKVLNIHYKNIKLVNDYNKYIDEYYF